MPGRCLGCCRMLMLAWALALPGLAPAQARTATDAQGHALRLDGSIVIVEPDIELSLVTAGGLAQPSKEWSETARRLFPQAVHAVLAQHGTPTRPDFTIPADLDPTSRLGQILRLNEAVALSIAQYSQPGSVLATKKDPATGQPRLDWSLGPGVAGLHEATGADYALFTYIRDSYASGGRKALRVLTLIAGAALGSYADIGGGRQIGVATLVDLRSGKVIWFNLLQRQSGDLRDVGGAQATAAQLLTDLPR